MTHICNPSTWEAETGRSGVKVILCYMMSLGYMRPHFKNQREKKGEGKKERGGTMRAKEYSRSCSVALVMEYVSASSCFPTLLCSVWEAWGELTEHEWVYEYIENCYSILKSVKAFPRTRMSMMLLFTLKICLANSRQFTGKFRAHLFFCCAACKPDHEEKWDNWYD